MKKIITAIIISLTLTSGVAFSHSGGTNSEGCHNDHKRGTYHCH